MVNVWQTIKLSQAEAKQGLSDRIINNLTKLYRDQGYELDRLIEENKAYKSKTSHARGNEEGRTDEGSYQIQTKGET